MQEDELNIEIWRLLQSGHLSKARALIETGLRNIPDSWLLLEKEGILQLQLKHYSEAIDIFKTLIERDPGNTNSYLNMSLALSNQARFAEAIDVLKSQLPFDENNIHINLMLADAYKNLGKMGLAREHYARYARHANHYRPPRDAKTYGTDATKLLNILIDLLCIEPVAVDIASAIRTEKILEAAQRNLYLVNSLTERDENQPRQVIKVLVERISNFYVPYYIANCRPFFEAYSRFLTWVYYDEIKNTKALQNIVTPGPPRIALISENFGLHSTWWIYYMFEDLLKVTPVDLTIFSINQQADNDQLKQYLKFGSVQHVSLSPTDVPSFSQAIAKLGFHAVVLPDVGMSSISRNLSVFPLSPRQIVFWTHPITTGSTACTDFLTNSLMDCAQDAEAHYTERPVVMKGLGIHFSSPKAITCTRQLKTRKKRLCSIQTLSKYHPSFDYIYNVILSSLGDIELYFLNGESADQSEIFQKRILATLSMENRAKVKFVARMPKAEYQEFLMDSLCVIDTPFWSGGNTTFDAVLVGTPVFACPGTTQMRANHSSAINKFLNVNFFNSCNLDELCSKLDFFVNNPIESDLLVQEMLRNCARLNTSQHYLADFKDFINSLESCD